MLDVFFFVSKVVWFLIQPSSLIAVLLAVGTALLWTRRARAGRLFVCTSLVLYLVLGLSPLGHMIMLPLEDRFAPADIKGDGKDITGIIVLGGAQDTIVSGARQQVTLNEAGERMLEAVVLARRLPQAQLVFSGGSGAILYDDLSEAEIARRAFKELGIATDRVRLESRSRNTYENALRTKELVKPKPGERWLLITSAFHMPRSIGCFRKVGFPVEPWPVDYRTRGPQDVRRVFQSFSEGLKRFDLAAREWVGLVVYRLAGRTDALLPGR